MKASDWPALRGAKPRLNDAVSQCQCYSPGSRKSLSLGISHVNCPKPPLCAQTNDSSELNCLGRVYE